MANRKITRKGRKNSRKNSRKGSRKANRKNTRKNKRQSGGNAMQQSLAQGIQYLGGAPGSPKYNMAGGAYTPLGGAPVGDTGVLDAALRDIARVGPLDHKLTEIVGMRDPDQPGGSMSGGRRRNRKNRKDSRKNRKNSRKNSRKNRKNSRKNRKNSRRQGGGGHWSPSPIGAPNMLLSQSEAAKAGTADFSNPLLKN